MSSHQRMTAYTHGHTLLTTIQLTHKEPNMHTTIVAHPATYLLYQHTVRVNKALATIHYHGLTTHSKYQAQRASHIKTSQDATGRGPHDRSKVATTWSIAQRS
jgi:hypothetical protein